MCGIFGRATLGRRASRFDPPPRRSREPTARRAPRPPRRSRSARHSPHARLLEPLHLLRLRAPLFGGRGLSPQRYKVRFTATEEYVRLIEEAKALLSHAVPNVTLEDLQVRAMRALVTELKRRSTPASIARPHECASRRARKRCRGRFRKPPRTHGLGRASCEAVGHGDAGATCPTQGRA